uniref:Uncharacterized protein n=1 Tax=Candidatus Kentrum sp. FM TaxID=2126340 RepID=A0A450U0P1_9GAMM|nr:MAG: hypothetical protein BECKFM1743A_GA0114220_101897 [Candidatus Kentron sp. FM]VFJ75802.1 MAG: hypothetical protein BECKFM1743C_GA0114222_108812 [Candidatus Kentron sp. FM]VFK23712.1 MAG: hypothetical protein BECKFM1743B_GA0114221_109421 [Candidatus Kentron sp. FM]
MSTAVSVHLPDKLTFQLGGMASATGRSVSLVVQNGSTLAPEDPIVRARGMLKGKKGGTALFLRDKQAEIEREDRL